MAKRVKKRKFGLRQVLLVVFAAVFCVSAFMVGWNTVQARREAQAFEDLRALMEQVPDPAPPPEPSREPEPEPPEPSPPTEEELRAAVLAGYQQLQEQNGDFFGWVRIPGTVIDYPVMYTPDSPEYYLHRGFDKKYAGSGVPFLDGACYPGCGNYIVYGHHMRNGTMFASLTEYADEAYWEEHPVVEFDTTQELAEYEVVAAFYSRVYRKGDEGVFRYYNYTDLTDPAVFDEYVRLVRGVSCYDTGIVPEYGDTLLTLSTCSYHTEEGRFVLVARRVEETAPDEPEDTLSPGDAPEESE